MPGGLLRRRRAQTGCFPPPRADRPGI